MKPILFNTEMVRAILEGRKTVTRRVIKGARSIFHFLDLETDPDICSVNRWGDGVPKTVKGLYAEFEADDSYPIDFPMFKSPYQVGDILYIRETWREYNGKYFFKANEPKEYDDYMTSPKWKPSIHMPKEAARIFLKVTDVRVESLQEITNEGCKAEGTDLDEWYEYDEWQHQVGDGCVADGIPVVFETLRGFFGSRIWNSTIKNKDEYYRYGWDANPWVWVIEFERIEKGENNDR